ncbi:hypothetical protein HGRIS_005785 [Hohenbuehelia grisea]|uniref:Uncharacterized protein n=1 Tax=Hohenbuehelia grisea TaxID=104357 RepID=A0ABR3K054_9AGAR
MNLHYNKAIARDVVEREANGRNDDVAMKAYQLCEMTKQPNWRESISVLKVDQPLSWRLIRLIDGGEQEELTFNIQGVISNNHLPPFLINTRYGVAGGSRIKFLKQGVAIVGLGDPNFDRALENMDRLINVLSRHVPDGRLLPAEGRSGEGDEAQVDLINRYLTPRHEQPLGCEVPFANGVDPKNILRALTGKEYFHGEDNQVAYMERTHTNPAKYEEILPCKFRDGDVVEVQLSFTMTPVKGGNFKVQTILRGITLLDGSVAEVSGPFSHTVKGKLKQDLKAAQQASQRETHAKVVQKPARVPKRRMMYEIETKLKNCRIDNADEDMDDEV